MQNEIQMERGISSTGGQTGREPRKNPRSGDLRQRKKLRNGVPSFGLDGNIYKNVGTSFSTLKVSRIAAELAFMMHEDFDALLIRALMIHYAKYPADIKMKMTDKVAQMGFGM